ncbi:MAG: type II 3-dehydroquinate dehydratase, partial [Firmicutes bacterium]|nr:type II 3-dehydroquinate dehydratase [Bacillota bacterium]
MRILVIHGPNLNLLGTREPGTYGTTTLAELDDMVRARARELGIAVEIVQHSSEGDIIDAIHSSRAWAEAIVINPAAYSHYSIAIRDAIASVRVPVVEVHLTNIFAREDFRARSVTGAVAHAVISGLGPQGYLLAIEYLARR